MTAHIHFGIVAGEKSGDILGAGLIGALREIWPDARFSGIGGPAMEALGCESLAPMERLAVMGLVEPLARLPELLAIKRRLQQHFLASPPDVFIGIDAPDFNLRLAKSLHRGGITTVHYVSPSVWAWRKGRIRGIANSIDLMLTLFPFETAIYQQHGIPVRCVGHPLADEIDPAPDMANSKDGMGNGMGHPSATASVRPDAASQSQPGSSAIPDHDRHRTLARQQLAIDPDARVIALLPGSRKGEISRMAPVFLATAAAAKQEYPELRFLLPYSDAENRALLESIIREGCYAGADCSLLDDSRQAMAAADFVILASGTASLEAMLLRRPMVVCYKLAPITYAIASRMVQVEHMAIPNLLAGERLAPEYVQHEVNTGNLLSEIRRFMKNPTPAPELLQKFASQHRLLRKNASTEAATAIRDLLTNPNHHPNTPP